MVNYLIGDILKSFREYKKLSISELSDGICTEDELISFEKDKAYPRLDTVYKLADRLNMDVSYFFNVVSETRINYSTAVIQLIEKYKRERNYHAIDNIVHQEMGNPLFSPPLLAQYIKWHEGICVFYIEKDLIKAESILNEAISITNPNRINLTERETEILNSIAILYYENSDFHSALPIYLEAQTNLDKLPHILNSKVKIRVLFGLSQVFTKLGDYEESIKYCRKGIDLCINEESLYCFNEFHYQMGDNYIKLGENESGKKYLDECLHLLKLENKTRLLEIMEKEVEKLSINC